MLHITMIKKLIKRKIKIMTLEQRELLHMMEEAPKGTTEYAFMDLRYQIQELKIAVLLVLIGEA